MHKSSFTISGNIVDIIRRRIFQGTISIDMGKIVSVVEKPVSSSHYITPGLIDAHIHIESSMLIPSEFARLAVTHGTVATVSDPHEIANVLGVNGIKFMIGNGKKVPFKFYFGASSCVPATPFETSGASLGYKEIEDLLKMDEVKYMSEMMNYPGVLHEDEDVMAKLALARKYRKPVDGHAPGLKGEDARKYIGAGITTDHECFTLEEAEEKIGYGMKILIREGSAARNFDALIGLMDSHPDMVMFCSDDRHPDDLSERHIDDLVRRAISKGYDPLQVLRSCVLNPIAHYKLDVGLLQPGDPADFIVIDDLRSFQVLETYIEGIKVAENGETMITSVPEITPNKFNAVKIGLNALAVRPDNHQIRVIEALEGQLITHALTATSLEMQDNIVSDPENDVLKLVVLNRYTRSIPAIAFVKNFGLKRGAIASTVAHDSHNIIAIGVSDEDILRAINAIIDTKGGICCADGNNIDILPLPVAGLMSEKDGFDIARTYERLDMLAKQLGSKLRAPFMTLSFMALLVIPELKLSDKGLFDGKSFSFTSLFVK